MSQSTGQQTGAPTKPAAPTGLLPIPLESLDCEVHDLDFYLKRDGEPVPTLYRAKGFPLTPLDIERLREAGVEFFYIPTAQHAEYRRVLNRRLDKTFADPDKSKQERAKVIRSACVKLIDDVFAFPGEPEMVRAIGEVSAKFRTWSESDPQGFGYLLDMSAHDYYTTTHMVNVGVGCGLLYAKLRPDDGPGRELIHQGGLLHDVGKRGIAQEILNKEGKLTDEEWAQIRTHPDVGFQELGACPGISSVVLEMTRDHHERLDGTGYPNRAVAEQLSLAARICAVVDVYDALSSARPYRPAIPPTEVLGMMSKDVGKHFDPEVFNAWRAVIEGMIAEEPARTFTKPEKPCVMPDISLPQRARPLGTERRLDPRKKVQITVDAAYVTQLKQAPVSVGTRFKVRVLDISRGGMGVETRWPMSINEILIFNVPKPDGSSTDLRARVVRVRRRENGTWFAGLSFMMEAGKAVA